ncbi:hypothetical protein [Rhizobium sp.]|uniref:hypothetical protein n=1 Tax=Rhizobium sp. TaxID=391 RepID=UPI0028A9E04B
MVVDSERRRTIFDQVRAKSALRGMPIDDDPEFLAWIELWISGDYDMSELRSQYNDLMARRAQRPKFVPDLGEPPVRDAKAIDIPGADGDPAQTTVRDAD